MGMGVGVSVGDSGASISCKGVPEINSCCAKSPTKNNWANGENKTEHRVLKPIIFLRGALTKTSSILIKD